MNEDPVENVLREMFDRDLDLRFELEFLQTSAHLSPEKELLKAALFYAISELHNIHRDVRWKAAAWIARDDNYAIGFLSVCEALKLEPCGLRRRLKSRIEAALRSERHPALPLIPISHDFVGQTHCRNCNRRYRRMYQDGDAPLRRRGRPKGHRSREANY